MKKQYDMHCNIAQTLNLIGDRWTLLILHAVREGRRTYKDLQEGLEGIPTNLLLIYSMYVGSAERSYEKRT